MCGSISTGFFREPREGEKLVTDFFQAIGDRTAFQPPFVDERFSLRLDLRLRTGLDYVAVIGGDVVVQRRWCMNRISAVFLP